MGTTNQVVDLLNKVGGHVCSIDVGRRTDPIFFTFVGRITSVNYEYEEETLQIHYKQAIDGHECLGNILLCTKECQIRGHKIIAKGDNGDVYVEIAPLANSQKGVFSNNLRRVQEKTLECPNCGKKCSSTSGLTLHKKQCQAA